MKRLFLFTIDAFFAVIALLLTSCVRDVFLDAGERSQVVVECVLTNDETSLPTFKVVSVSSDANMRRLWVI